MGPRRQPHKIRILTFQSIATRRGHVVGTNFFKWPSDLDHNDVFGKSQAIYSIPSYHLSSTLHLKPRIRNKTALSNYYTYLQYQQPRGKKACPNAYWGVIPSEWGYDTANHNPFTTRTCHIIPVNPISSSWSLPRTTLRSGYTAIHLALSNCRKV